MTDWTTLIPSVAGAGGVAGLVLAALKSKRVRAAVARLIEADNTLNNKIQLTVASAVSALEAALEARGEELVRVEQELADLRAEVAKLRTADKSKDARINELEREVEELRAENAVLRAEVARRRGGRPKKETA
jgi:peptidoglycan hydrolase CwlO-like protein